VKPDRNWDKMDQHYADRSLTNKIDVRLNFNGRYIHANSEIICTVLHTSKCLNCWTGRKKHCKNSVYVDWCHVGQALSHRLAQTMQCAAVSMGQCSLTFRASPLKREGLRDPGNGGNMTFRSNLISDCIKKVNY